MSTEVQKTTTEEKTPARAWLILAVTFLASFAAPMTQFKIPPLASWLIPEFSMDGVTFGYLMSALGIIGLILAFPASMICRKLGLKKTMLVSVGMLIVGNLISVLATSYGMLAAARFIEGVGLGLVGVAGPSCVSVWFPEKTRPLALGIWACWVPLGIVLMFNTAPAIAEAAGWKTVFWIVLIVCIIAFVLFAIIFKLPGGKTEQELDDTSLGDSLKLLKNPRIWVLGLTFLCFNFVMLGVINTFYNSFLESTGMTAQAAASLTSIVTIIPIFGQPIIGAIITKTAMPLRHRKIFLACGFALFFIGMICAWHPDVPAALFAFIAIAGVGGSISGAVTRPMAPSIMPAGAAGAAMGMGVLQFCQNLGAAAGSPIFGWGFETLGWEAASNCIVLPVLAIGFILCFFTVAKNNEK